MLFIFARRHIEKSLLRPHSVINILPSRAIYYIGACENRILLPAPANVIIMPHAQKTYLSMRTYERYYF